MSYVRMTVASLLVVSIKVFRGCLEGTNPVVSEDEARCPDVSVYEAYGVEVGDAPRSLPRGRMQRPYTGSVFHRKMDSENGILNEKLHLPTSFSVGKRFLYTAPGSVL